MYVLVNKKHLTLPQCAVQAGHAIAEFMALYGQEENVRDWCLNEQHRTMIILGARERDLEEMMAKYDELGLKYREFREPDLDNLLTAVAFEPVWNEDGRELFGKFQLI
jgi:hypothetical protein